MPKKTPEAMTPEEMQQALIPFKEPGKTPEDRLREAQVRAIERKELLAVSGEKSLRNYLSDLLHDVVEPAPAIPKPKQYGKRGASEEVMALLLSDWHAYEVVKKSRVLDLNEYNADIFGRRIKRVIDSTISIKQRMEKGGGWSFPKLVVICNGDFISGTIHELERHTDAPNVVSAVHGCWRVLSQAIGELAGEFSEIDVFCTSGNHGRLPDARRMQQKDPTRNWDTMIYLGAKEVLRSTSHVRFIIPDSYLCMFEVLGWRFMSCHGHEIKSAFNIPFYGLDRFGRNINALLSVDSRAPHYYLISHFHTQSSLAAPGGEMLINGSLIGGSENVLNRLGKCDRPSQLLFCVHKEHGVTSRWPLLAQSDSLESYDVRPWAE